MKNKNKNKGFTIVELIVVMAIIAILILVAVPMFTKYIDRANKTAEMANVQTIYKSSTNALVEYLYFNESPYGGDWMKFIDSVNEGVDSNIDIAVWYYAEPDRWVLRGTPDNEWGVYMHYDYGEHGGSALSTKDSIIILTPVRDGKRGVYKNNDYMYDISEDFSDVPEVPWTTRD